MPIDPRISLMVQPMQIESPMNALAKGLALKESIRNSQFNQMKMDDMRRAVENKNALRARVSQPDINLNDPRVQSEILSMGGGDFLKDRADLLKTDAETKKSQVMAAKEKLGLLKLAAGAVMANPNYEAAKRELVRLGRLTGDDITDDLAQLDTIAQDPNAIRQWAAGYAIEADKLLPKFDTRDLGGTVERVGYDPLTGKQIGQPQVMRKTMTPGEAQRISIDQQRLGLEGERVQIARDEQSRKASVGDTNLSPKNIQKLELSYPKAKLALGQTESSIDKLKSDLNALKNDTGLPQITGVVYGNLPAGASLSREARRAKALFENIIARGQFQELQNMRNSSPTGGALGNVSNQEGQYLRQAFAALDRAQNTEDVQNVITNLVNDLENSKTRIRDAFDTTYEYKGGAGEKPAGSRGAAGRFDTTDKPGKSAKEMTDAEFLKALGM